MALTWKETTSPEITAPDRLRTWAPEQELFATLSVSSYLVRYGKGYGWEICYDGYGNYGAESGAESTLEESQAACERAYLAILERDLALLKGGG